MHGRSTYTTAELKGDGSMSSVQHVDECVIRWWRGYVKSCFYVLVDSSSPADGLLMSPLFWSLRKSSLTPDGPIAAAHQQLIEQLVHEGWQPAGVGTFWYEQRFLRYEQGLLPKARVRVAADEQLSAPAPAERAPPTLEASPKPARPAKADDRAPPVGKKPTKARSPHGAPPARGQSMPRVADPRRARRSSARGARLGSHRPARSSLRAHQLVGAAVVVGWAAFVTADVAALLLALAGS